MIFGQYWVHFNLHREIRQHLTWIITGSSAWKDTEYSVDFSGFLHKCVNIYNPIFLSGKNYSLQFVTAYILKKPKPTNKKSMMHRSLNGILSSSEQYSKIWCHTVWQVFPRQYLNNVAATEVLVVAFSLIIKRIRDKDRLVLWLLV